MSFILDALKKSDAKRRAQLGPDLATSSAPPAVSSSRQPKPLIIWGLFGLVGLLLIVVSALVWLVSDQEAPQLDIARTQQEAFSQTDAVDERADGNLRQSSPPAEPIEIVEEPIAVVPSEVTTSSIAPQPTVEQAVVVADQTPESQPVSAPAVPEPESASVEALEARLAAVSESESQSEAVNDVEQTAQPAGGESTAEAKEPEATWQPKAADYLYEWELPLTVRQSLPALNLLVHVYANLPDDRFVLINGTRFREGDELAPGVRLAEIRPEGALIDFRDYRFLLSQ